MESRSHSSKYCVACCRALVGIAPSEWLTRWTQCSRLGKRDLRATRSRSPLVTEASDTELARLKVGEDFSSHPPELGERLNLHEALEHLDRIGPQGGRLADDPFDQHPMPISKPLHPFVELDHP